MPNKLFPAFLVALATLPSLLLYNLYRDSQSELTELKLDTQTHAATVAVNTAGINTELLSNAIKMDVFFRRIIREELSLINDKVAVTDANNCTNPAKNKPPLTDNQPAIKPEQQLYAIQTSQNVIANAIANGAWRKDDNFQILPHIADLPEPKKNELLNQFIDAINRQELRLDAPPPF